MPTFRVSWEIDIEADTAHEAAEKALEIQRDPDSIATVFWVAQGESGAAQFIDLTEGQNPVCPTCNRHTDAPGFDGCMTPNCPKGYEPCL